MSLESYIVEITHFEIAAAVVSGTNSWGRLLRPLSGPLVSGEQLLRGRGMIQQGRTMQARGPFRFSQVFVGRASEMRQLRTAAEDAAKGQGCVVTVTGDPGIGKSRLLEAFVGETSTNALVLQGRCPYAEGAPPYLPWGRIISGYVSATKPELLRTVMGLVPFDTEILGVEVTVERIDMTDYEQIVAVCTRGKSRQRIAILELPLPDLPPAGAEWIDAYRRWARGK